MIKQKIEWYKAKQQELKLSVETERESIQLDREGLDRECAKMLQQITTIESQKGFVRSEKDKATALLVQRSSERQMVLDRVGELR